MAQNPPLAAYYLALVSALLGWSEMALHAGFLLPALALVVGTYKLAHHFGADPMAAALVTITAPVFLLTSTSIMCDTMMLALWVWSVCFWVQGFTQQYSWRLCVAGLLIAACSLTKYFGMSLIPLLLMYSLLERRKVGGWVAHLFLPVLVLLFYQWMTYKLYGRGLLLEAAGYATHYRVGGELPAKLLSGLAFGGGGMIILLLAAPLLWKREAWLICLGALAVLGGLGLAVGKIGAFEFVADGRVRWWFWIQAILFVAGGCTAILLGAGDWLRHKTALSALLFAWVAGVFLFATAINWTVSGRHIFPMLPAVSLLLVRRLDLRVSRRGQSYSRWLLLPLGGSLMIALLVAWGDYRLAASAREAASLIKREFGSTAGTVWFQGHWGFQYYMELNGAKPVNREDFRFLPNDVVVVPLGNSYLFPLPEDRVSARSAFDCPASQWVATMNATAGAGYYSDGWGPLPFVLGSAPSQKYLVFRIR